MERRWSGEGDSGSAAIRVRSTRLCRCVAVSAIVMFLCCCDCCCLTDLFCSVCVRIGARMNEWCCCRTLSCARVLSLSLPRPEWLAPLCAACGCCDGLGVGAGRCVRRVVDRVLAAVLACWCAVLLLPVSLSFSLCPLPVIYEHCRCVHAELNTSISRKLLAVGVLCVLCERARCSIPVLPVVARQRCITISMAH